MKANILNQTKHIDVQATKSATSSSKKMKLFRYSLKVITASAAAIVLLILTFKLPNPSYEEIDIPTPIIISDIEQEATLASSIRSHMDHISNQILNFSNNIINMEVIKNDKKKNSFLHLFFLITRSRTYVYGIYEKRSKFDVFFFFILFMSSWLNIGPLLLIAIIVWFYSFFDTNNIRSLPDDEFYALEDDYILFPDFLKENSYQELQKKYRYIIALALIIIGFTILWDNFYSIFSGILPNYLIHIIYSFGHYMPQLVIGVVIILFGIYLIQGKKHELDDNKGGNRGEDS